MKISKVAPAVYHRLAGQRVRSTILRPSARLCPPSPASRLFFFHPRLHHPPRSIFVTTCEQTAARTHARTQTRAGFRVCARGKHGPLDNADGTRRIHISRCTAARTPLERERERKRAESSPRGQYGGEKEKGGKKRACGAKVAAGCETWEYGDGIADIGRENSSPGTLEEREKKEEEEAESRGACKYFSSPGKIEPPLSLSSTFHSLPALQSRYLYICLASIRTPLHPCFVSLQSVSTLSPPSQSLHRSFERATLIE